MVKKSDNPLSQSYNPSIFPDVYKQRAPRSNEKSDERHKRFQRRRQLPITDSRQRAERSEQEEASWSQAEESMCIDFQDELLPKQTSQAVQVDITFEVEAHISGFSFSCEMDGLSKGTSVYIPSVATKNTQTSTCGITRDVAVGSDTAESDLKTRGERNFFHGYESVLNDDMMVALCGVSLRLFHVLLEPVKSKGGRKISHEDKLMIFLMKIKHGISFIAIAAFFGIHRTTTARIFTDILQIMSSKFWHYVFWPSRFAIRKSMPDQFKKNYPNCRAIIDCTEIPLERPSTVEKQIFFYSHYKSKFTAKFLISIAPNGFISFVSHAYGGRSTDVNITVDSSFLDLVEPGDVILADKGFAQIRTSLASKQVELVMPPFASKEKPQFTATEMEECYDIASVRIHVERVLGQVKRFRILYEINNDLLPFIDEIFRFCCVLTNLSSPVVT